MIFIGIGGNLTSRKFGSSFEVLRSALQVLDSNECKVVRCSPWYRSAPVPLTDQPDYLNAVFEVTTEFSAERLLAFLHEIERKFGRIRTVKNASRIIDLDLIAYHHKATRQKGNGRLCLPHPRLTERTFVLLQLFDLAPNWIHPVNGKHILELIKELPKNQRCERV